MDIPRALERSLQTEKSLKDIKMVGAMLALLAVTL